MIDPMIQMVVEVRELQGAYPAETVYGVHDSELLEKTNDNEFLYLVDRVKMLRQFEKAPANTRVVILTRKGGGYSVDYSRLEHFTTVDSAGGRYEMAVGRTKRAPTVAP